MSETWADAQFDMLEAAYDEVPIEAKACIAELTAERDEWQAKAEKYAEALEKLGCSVLANGTVFEPPEGWKDHRIAELEAENDEWLARTCYEEKSKQMAEYITDMSYSKYQSETDLISVNPRQVHENIVRCKDCKHYTPDPNPTDPGWPMYCDDTGREMLEPNGFCAWGEKKETGVVVYVLRGTRIDSPPTYGGDLYEIVGIFSTHEAAKKAIKEWPDYKGLFITKWEVDEKR